ncbi:PLP-dependent transferase [Wallemia mellicola]|uniref:PLP-dependent transferase n=1 Tax=Wallemia mellicola TaxID=1708541 RepID=A0A4T0P1Y4_9BASI|nr:PLP-dependent transferase [Wallemia mellicola]
MSGEVKELETIVNEKLNVVESRDQEVPLSKRGMDNYNRVAGRMGAFEKLMADMLSSYDADKNPEGIINLGVAESGLMADELIEYYNTHFKLRGFDLTYGNSLGTSIELGNAMADFFNRILSPVKPIRRGDIVVGVGMSAVISQLSWYICERGEGMLIGAPYYNGFDADLTAQSQVVPVEVQFRDSVDPLSVTALEDFERVLLESEKKGTKIRALLVSSPQNPLGWIISRETLIAYGKFAQKYNIHFICDEIYALSTFKSKDVPSPPEFISAASINWEEHDVDPSRVHILVGASKDFASNGLRVGGLISQYNRDLISALATSAILMKLSSPSDILWRTLLADEKFMDWYIPENQRRLSDSYNFATDWCKRLGIPYEKACAGFFFLIDLRGYFPTRNAAGDILDSDEKRLQELSSRLVANKVLLNPGTSYHHRVLGMFRLTHTLYPSVQETGLARVEKTLKEIRSGNV